MHPESGCLGRVEELPELAITASGEVKVGKGDQSASQYQFLLCRALIATKKPLLSSLCSTGKPAALGPTQENGGRNPPL